METYRVDSHPMRTPTHTRQNEIEKKENVLTDAWQFYTNEKKTLSSNNNKVFGIDWLTELEYKYTILIICIVIEYHKTGRTFFLGGDGVVVFFSVGKSVERSSG